jgi:hypothetical protein
MRSDTENPALVADTASEAKTKYPRRKSRRYIDAGIFKRNANGAVTVGKLRGRKAAR